MTEPSRRSGRPSVFTRWIASNQLAATILAAGYAVAHLAIATFAVRHHDPTLVVSSLLNLAAAFAFWYSVVVALPRRVRRWDETHRLMFRTKIPPT